MSILIRAAFAVSLFACSPSQPAQAPRPAFKPAIVPFPGALASLSATQLHVSAQPPRLEPKSGVAWPVKGVWTLNMLTKRLGALGINWFDGEAARRRIIEEDFPKLRDELGTIAVERISLIPDAAREPGSVVLTWDLAETGVSFALESEQFVHMTLAYGRPQWRVAIDVPDDQRGAVTDGAVLDGIFELGEMHASSDGQPTITAHLHAIRLRSVPRKEILYDSLAAR